MHHFNFCTPVFAGLAFSVLLFSCSSDTTEPLQYDKYPAEFYLVNEGAFGGGTGTIGYYNGTTAGEAVTNPNLYKSVNNVALGDVVQSLAFHNGKGYIAVNNSQKMEVVNAESFVAEATIALASPRHFAGINAAKAYITDWGATPAEGSVKVLDLVTNTITGSIAAGAGPEKLLLNGQKMYVSNSGGMSTDSILTVINTLTDQVEDTIVVAPMPNAMQKDANEKLWVICGGQYGFGGTPDKAGALVKVNLAQNQPEMKLFMPSATDHPQALAISPGKDYLYYNLFDKVYRMPVNATSLPAEPFITVVGANFYNIQVNPANGDVILLDSPYNQTTGKVYVYSATGQQLKVLPSGHITNSIVFKP